MGQEEKPAGIRVLVADENLTFKYSAKWDVYLSHRKNWDSVQDALRWSLRKNKLYDAIFLGDIDDPFRVTKWLMDHNYPASVMVITKDYLLRKKLMSVTEEFGVKDKVKGQPETFVKRVQLFKLSDLEDFVTVT